MLQLDSNLVQLLSNINFESLSFDHVIEYFNRQSVLISNLSLALLYALSCFSVVNVVYCFS